MPVQSSFQPSVQPTGHPSARPSARPIQALRPCLAPVVAAIVALLAVPAQAVIVVTGEVTPVIPTGGTVPGGVSVGGSSPGSLQIDGGSSFASGQLWLAGNSTQGQGSVRVSGAGTTATISNTAGGNLDIGGRGIGQVTVADGASMSYGVTGSDCQLNCRVFVSNAAGSNGSLTVTGAGAQFSTPGRIVVGNASVFTQATDGFDYGVPGGASTGLAQVLGGGVLRSSAMTVAAPGGGNGRLGSETSSGTLVVDGAGSTVGIARNAAQTGALSLLDVAAGRNTSGTLTLRNGGRLTMDGSSTNDATGLRVGVGAGSGSNTVATLNIDGAGSRLDVNGSGSFIFVGVTAGSNAQAFITNGGALDGSGAYGLTYGSIGRDGGTGSLTVSGQDAAGVSSSVRFSGLSNATGGGSFLKIGTNDAAPGGRGTLSVLGGGRLEIDMRGVVSATSSLLGGFYVGFGANASGTLTVSGVGSVNGAASSFAALGGTGFAPYAGVGRDGGTGSVTVSGGGQLLIDSAHASDPNATSNTSGNSVVLDIGRNATASELASTGVVTVTGAGSALRLGGIADNFLVVGRGAGGNGTLNVRAGGAVSALDLQIGRDAGGSGVLNMTAGLLNLSGTFTSSGLQGRGSVFNVGHANGTGIANIAAGSLVTVSSLTGSVPAFTVGGSQNNPGGTGTLLLSGSSMLDVIGSGAAVRIGHTASDAAHPGVGTAVLSGDGTRLSATSGGAGTAGSIIIASGPYSSGSVIVGAGALLSSDGSIGVAYAGSPLTGSSTGGSGVLVVNGRASAPQVIVGAGGYLGGSGVVSGHLYNRGGIIGPGNSPGILRVDGGFDNSQGQLIVEVQRQADGSYITDQLILGDSSDIVFGSGRISFSFLGDTDPTAFQASGQFELKSFFKAVDTGGNVIDWPSSALGAFSGVQFDAQAEAYTISQFHFDAVNGASFVSIPVVPQPPAAWLMTGGLLMLALRRLRAQR